MKFLRTTRPKGHKTAPWLVTILLLAGLTLGAALRSPKDQASQPVKFAVATTPARSLVLAWDMTFTNNNEYYSYDQPSNTVYNIERRVAIVTTNTIDLGSNRVSVFTNRTGRVKTNSVRYVTQRTERWGWQHVGTTTNQTYTVWVTNASDFFRVGASNTYFHP